MKVKWGKELYEDVEVDLSEDPMLFKAQLFALTGVEPHRQKIMCKVHTIVFKLVFVIIHVKY